MQYEASAQVDGEYLGVPEEILGCWVNTNEDSGGISNVLISEGASGYILNAFGRGEDGPISWGEVVFQPCVAPRGQVGFFTEYVFDDATIRLGANYKLGVLVIMAMTTFTDDSGRAPYMERTFYCREELTGEEAFVSLDELEGRWCNTSDTPALLASLDIYAGEQGYLMRAECVAGPLQGSWSLTSYVDNMDYLAFKGETPFEDGSFSFYGNTQKELIVLTTFRRGASGNRAYREFFYRAD